MPTNRTTRGVRGHAAVRPSDGPALLLDTDQSEEETPPIANTRYSRPAPSRPPLHSLGHGLTSPASVSAPQALTVADPLSSTPPVMTTGHHAARTLPAELSLPPAAKQRPQHASRSAHAHKDDSIAVTLGDVDPFQTSRAFAAAPSLEPLASLPSDGPSHTVPWTHSASTELKRVDASRQRQSRQSGRSATMSTTAMAGIETDAHYAVSMTPTAAPAAPSVATSRRRSDAAAAAASAAATRALAQQGHVATPSLAQPETWSKGHHAVPSSDSPGRAHRPADRVSHSTPVQSGPMNGSARPLSPRSSNLRSIFLRVDVSQDGKISRAELIKALRNDQELAFLLNLPQHIREGGTRDQFVRIYSKIEAGRGHGGITWAEFKKYLDEHRIPTTVHEEMQVYNSAARQVPQPIFPDDDHDSVAAASLDHAITEPITPPAHIGLSEPSSQRLVPSDGQPKQGTPTSSPRSRPVLSQSHGGWMAPITTRPKVERHSTSSSQPTTTSTDVVYRGRPSTRVGASARDTMITRAAGSDGSSPVDSIYDGCEKCYNLEEQMIKYIAHVAHLEERIRMGSTEPTSMCTAEISNSASHVEQNRLHQHTIADLEAEVTTLTEQDRRHRQHIAVLEHKLQHSLTQSHKAAEPLKANAPQEPGSNTDQSPHSNEVKEQYEQGLAALSIEKAEELAAAITQLRSEYERRDEKKSRTYAHVLKRNKLHLRSETHHLREENNRLRDQIKEALRVIDRNAAMLVASSTALRDAQRTGARSSILDDSIGLDDALDDGPQFAWLEQVGTETLAESAAHLGQRGHHGNVDSGGSDALSDIEMQALYTRVRSTIVRKDSIIDQLKSKYREAQRNLAQYENN